MFRAYTTRRIAPAALVVAVAGAGLLADPIHLGPRLYPDRADVAYGADRRQCLDLWMPLGERARPVPVLIYFHGGGFIGGDKDELPEELLRACRVAGLAVISADYRLANTAPYPGPMRDGARVVQFVRHRAAGWDLDPNRIAVAGSSAGAGIALWVALHDDLAEPGSPDPVARRSSRPACAAVLAAQTTYDPEQIREWIGGRAHEHPALPIFYGVRAGAWDQAICREASPVAHVSRDDPPVWMYYSELDGPLPADARPGLGIHHPNFGRRLRDRMELEGVECVVRLRGPSLPGDEDAHRALAQHVARRLVRP